MVVTLHALTAAGIACCGNPNEDSARRLVLPFGPAGPGNSNLFGSSLTRRAGRPQARVSYSSDSGHRFRKSPRRLLVPFGASPFFFAVCGRVPGIPRSGPCGLRSKNAPLHHRDVDVRGRCTSSFSVALARRFGINVPRVERSAGTHQNSRHRTKHDCVIDQSPYRPGVRSFRNLRKPSRLPVPATPEWREGLNLRRRSQSLLASDCEP